MYINYLTFAWAILNITFYILRSFSIFTSDKMETSINMRVFKTILLLIALAAVSVDANPMLHYSSRDRDSRPDRNEASPADIKKEATDHYDQRQNGTENYRVRGLYPHFFSTKKVIIFRISFRNNFVWKMLYFLLCAYKKILSTQLYYIFWKNLGSPNNTNFVSF